MGIGGAIVKVGFGGGKSPPFARFVSSAGT